MSEESKTLLKYDNEKVLLYLLHFAKFKIQ